MSTTTGWTNQIEQQVAHRQQHTKNNKTLKTSLRNFSCSKCYPKEGYKTKEFNIFWDIARAYFDAIDYSETT